MEVSIRQLQEYLLEHYENRRTEQGLFLKLVEEMGEVAEVLNIRAGLKKGEISTEELGIELADIIHYTVAIAAINNIDLTEIILKKDEKAAIKYNHKINLKEYISKK